MTATWFLIVYIYACTNSGGGSDPGIIPGNCYSREARVLMPSLEICREVRAVNPQSKCMSEDFDK